MPQHIRVYITEPDTLETAIFDDAGRRYCPVHDVAEIVPEILALYEGIDEFKLVPPGPVKEMQAV